MLLENPQVTANAAEAKKGQLLQGPATFLGIPTTARL